MANITYYLGAGASYFACPILEMQAEMMIKLSKFELDNYTLDGANTLYINFDKDDNPEKFINDNKFQILWHIGYFGKKAQEYNTIDTYARKLYLNNEFKELNLLKMSVSVFFDLWENFYEERYKILSIPNRDLLDLVEEPKRSLIFEKIDKRYKSLFSVLIEKNENSIELNSNFNFISWNYDLQLEEAFKLFLGDKFDKSYKSINDLLAFKNYNDYNNIYHLNGYRGFFDTKKRKISKLKMVVILKLIGKK